jgi:predicted lipoprotein with Yx(FWY)xxD motif
MMKLQLPLVLALISGSVAFACSGDDDDAVDASGGKQSVAGGGGVPVGVGGRPAPAEGGAGGSTGDGGRPPIQAAGEAGQAASAAGLGGAEMAGAGAGAGGAPALTIQLAADGRLEGIDAAGTPRTLYFHGRDFPSFFEAAPAVSRCSEPCSVTWPPFHVDDVVAGEGLDGAAFGELEREDGTLQVTYRGWPLYAHAADSSPGDHVGEGMEELWHAAREPFPTLILMRQDMPQDSGLYLADGSGRTLYRLLGDQAGTASADPVSTCTTKGCRRAWPTFAPSPVKPVSSLTKGLAVFIRPDDSQLQVAYDGLPLYYFVDDVLPGDLLGVGRPSWVLATP